MPPSSGKKNNTAHSNDITDIKEQLSLLAEPAYRDFSSSLLPGTEHILGVRLPALRKIAGSWQKKTGWKTSPGAPRTALRKSCFRLHHRLCQSAASRYSGTDCRLSSQNKQLVCMRQLLHHPQGGRGEPRRVLGLPAALHPIR